MAQFSSWYEKAMGWEQGYSDHPSDRGGETYAGVTRRNFPTWTGWPVVDAEKRRNGGKLPQNHKIVSAALDGAVRELAKRVFWDFFRADQIKSQAVAEIIVDWGWASGSLTAAKQIQTLAGAVADGKFGDATIRAINRANAANLFEGIRQARIGFVRAIVARNPSQKVFLDGWINRIMDFDRPRRRKMGLKIAGGLLVAATLATTAWQYKYPKNSIF